MSAKALSRVFLSTAIYNYKLGRQIDQAGREAIKKEWAFSILKTLGFKLKVLGEPPRDEAQILVGNHISYLDIPVVLSTFPAAVFVAKDDLEKWPIIGAGAATAGTIFVSRRAGDDRTNAREQITKMLKEKNAKVTVFPAGTSTLYETVAWKKGIFEIAKEVGVPVKLFKLNYSPLRESAYVAQDQLLAQIFSLSKFKNKMASLTWLDRFETVREAEVFAEELRQQLTRA